METARLDLISWVRMRKRITYLYSFCYHCEGQEWGGRMGQRRNAELEVRDRGSSLRSTLFNHVTSASTSLK